MGDVDELARIQQAHHRRLLGLRSAAGVLVGDAWDTYAGLDVAAAAQFSAAAGVLVDEVRSQTSTIAVAYMNANDRAGGFAGGLVLDELPEIRNGIPSTDVYQRSIVEARRRISTGSTFDEAMAAGRARAIGTAETDVMLTNRATMAAGGEARPWVAGYRRVLTGVSCAFCATASTQRYKSAELFPMHPRCDCDVAEIFGDADPGHVINRDLLDALKEAGAETGSDQYWNGPYLVDADGTIRHRTVTNYTDDAGKRRQIVKPGDPVKPQVVDHGELGPTLTDSRHATARPRDIEPNPIPAEVTPPPRRTKATLQDPDVLELIGDA